MELFGKTKPDKKHKSASKGFLEMSVVYGIELFTYNLKDFKFVPGVKLYA